MISQVQAEHEKQKVQVGANMSQKIGTFWTKAFSVRSETTHMRPESQHDETTGPQSRVWWI